MDLSRLNLQQKQAVTYPVAPLMVMAGAGTGKTTVLTNRVAYLVEEVGLDPKRILAITFTNKAANEMNERIANLIGRPIEWIGTFHSVCIKILRREIYHLNRNNNFKVVDEEESTTIIKDIYEKYGYKNADMSYKNMLNIIESIKTNMYDLNDIRNPRVAARMGIVGDAQINMVVRVFTEYLNKFELYNYLDFNDILIFTDIILNSFEDARQYWAHRFDYVLVDEFQDTNDIQFRLIKTLAGSEFNVFAVGDEDQTIYTFRGANPEIINQFINHQNRKVPVIKLEENYRSTQPILDVANSIIAKNQNRIAKNLFSINKTGPKPILYVGESEDDEASWVVRKILYLTEEKGVQLKDIAILYRSNYLSRPYEQALISEGLRYTLFGGFKFYQRTEIKDIIAYLTAIDNNDELSIRRIINVPRRKISDETVKKVIDYANAKNLTFWDALNEVDEILTLSSSQKNAINSFVNMMYEFKNKDYLSIGDLFDDVVQKTEYIHYISDKDSQKTKSTEQNLQELKQGMMTYQAKNEQNWSLSHYLQEIALYTSIDDKKRQENSISLMTVHSSKGLEFNYVFLVDFVEGVFPSVHSVETNNGIQEERRLAYVALTRAKKELYICANNAYSFQLKTKKSESRFLMDARIGSIDRIKPTYVKRSSLDMDWFDSKAKPKVSKDEQYENAATNNYKVGDKVVHVIFGQGTVMAINGDILEISFKPPYNTKNIIYNHKSIKRQLM